MINQRGNIMVFIAVTVAVVSLNVQYVDLFLGFVGIIINVLSTKQAELTVVRVGLRSA
jgi:hypothetical protein